MWPSLAGGFLLALIGMIVLTFGCSPLSGQVNHYCTFTDTNLNSGDNDIFKYHFDIAPLGLPSGNYWLAMVEKGWDQPVLDGNTVHWYNTNFNLDASFRHGLFDKSLPMPGDGGFPTDIGADVAFQVQGIPDPNTGMIFALAFCLWGSRRRRNKGRVLRSGANQTVEGSRKLLSISRAERKPYSAIVLTGVAMVSLLPALHSSANGQGRNQTVVMTNDTTPGGFDFIDFTVPMLNNRGDVLFMSGIDTTASGSDDNSGLFLSNLSGSMNTIVLEGQQLNANENFIDLNSYYSMNRNGGVAFNPWVNNTGTGVNYETIFKYDSSLTEIARYGDSYGGGTFNSVHDPSINLQGEVTYFGNLSGSPNFHGLFRGSGGSIQSVAVENQTIPGSGGETFGGFFESPASNAFGDYAFSAFISNSNTSANEGIYLRHANGSIQSIVRNIDDNAPGFGGGQIGSFDAKVDVNDIGQVAFHAGIFNASNNSNQGFFRSDGVTTVSIGRRGQSTPTGDGIFGNSNQNNCLINNLGQVAFQIGIENSSTGFGDGVFRGDGTTTVEIARTGQSIGTNEMISPTLMRGLNESGQVLLDGVISDINNTYGDNALVAGDGTDLIVVARAGQQVGLKTIQNVWATNSSNGFGSGLNDFGQVAYAAAYTDGTESIEVWTPELHWRINASGNWDDNSKWTLSLNPANMHDVYMAPDANATIMGPASAGAARYLFLGGGNGTATLQLQNGGTINLAGEMFINASGMLTGDGRINGFVTNYGTVVADNVGIDNGTLFNYGVIDGNGRVDATINNRSSGEIRIGSGDDLRITGSSLTNSGRIENLGGKLEVDSNVTNNPSTGMITGRDSEMRFNGGVTNNGAMAFTFGTSDVFGDINNTGVINIAGGANVTFYDNLTQNGVLEVMAIGSSSSTAVLYGWDGAGGFTGGGDVYVAGDLRPGNSPASVLMDGNLYLGSTADTALELGGLDIGEFDQLIVTGDFFAGGALSVELINGFTLTANDEFLVADVFGSLSGQFVGLNEGDIVGNFGGHDLFISYAGGDGNDVTLFTAVPEPSSGAALFIALIGLTVFRRKSRQRTLDSSTR